MAAKRFLGLGFAFTATDKGLEKKLSSISGLVKEINSGIKNLGSLSDVAFDKMGKATKSARKGPMPKNSKVLPMTKALSIRPSSRLMKSANLTKYRSSDEKEYESKSKRSYGGMGDGGCCAKLVKAIKILAKAIGKGFNVLNKSFKDSVKGFGSNKQNTNNFSQKAKNIIEPSEEIVNSLKKNLGKDFGESIVTSFTKAFKEASGKGMGIDVAYQKGLQAVEDTLQNFKKVKFESLAIVKAYEYVSKYTGKVLGAAENFLDSVGLNIRSIFPKEVAAAFGVIGAIVSPLKDLAKSAMKKATELVFSKIGNQQTRIARDNLKTVRAQLKADKGFYSSTVDTSSGALRVVNVAGGDNKNKKGMFGKLGDVLKGFLPAALLSGLAYLLKPMSLLKKAVDLVVGGFSFVFKILSNFKNIGSALLSFFTGFGGILRTAVTFLGEFLGGLFSVNGLITGGIIVAIVAAVSTIWGFVETLWAGKDRILSFFSALGETVGLIGKIIYNFLEPALKPIANVFSSVSNVVSVVLDSIINAVKGFVDFFKNTVGRFLGESVLKAFDGMTKGLTNLNSDLKDFSDRQRSERLYQDGSRTNQGYSSKPYIIDGGESSKDPHSEETAKNTSEMVDKLDRVANILEKQSQKSQNITVQSGSGNAARDIVKAQNKASASYGGQ